MTKNPKWLVCSHIPYYPSICEYETEEEAREAYEETKQNCSSDETVYLVQVEEFFEINSTWRGKN